MFVKGLVVLVFECRTASSLYRQMGVAGGMACQVCLTKFSRGVT